MILVIMGAGGQGKEVKEIAEYDNEVSGKWSEIIFMDDYHDEGEFKKIRLLHTNTVFEKYSPEEIEFVIALGEPFHKKNLFDMIKGKGYHFGNVISPDSQISNDAILGEGLIIKRGAIVSADAQIGNNVTIQSYACIGHDAVIGNHCQISTHVDIGGKTVLGECVFVGLNVPIKEGLSIGDNSILSAGAVVLKNVESYVTVMGNPARVIAHNTKETRVFD